MEDETIFARTATANLFEGVLPVKAKADHLHIKY